MLGDCLNLFSQVDLNRFYVSTMAGYFPLERNAFHVAQKRCHRRQLRSVQAAKTFLIVCVVDYDPTGYREYKESNVVDLFSRKQSRLSSESVAIQNRPNLKWSAHYLRELESA